MARAHCAASVIEIAVKGVDVQNPAVEVKGAGVVYEGGIYNALGQGHSGTELILYCAGTRYSTGVVQRAT